jgi:hypothetical protein
LNRWNNKKISTRIRTWPESMSFSKVRMFVICICSSAEIFAAWSSASEIVFNFGIQIDVKGVKRFVIRNVPFMWERNVFMYCKYSSIFFFFTIARSISDSFLCLKCWYEKEIWRERVFIDPVLATVSVFFFYAKGWCLKLTNKYS